MRCKNKREGNKRGLKSEDYSDLRSKNGASKLYREERPKRRE